MKLQHIIIIFLIIIVPIVLVLSAYINSNIKTIKNQTAYKSSLINSTYDSIKAFQLNTANNMYSTISNSKIRDIEAAINVFYSSLATSLGTSGYSQDDLKSYVPSIIYTLYDGYYIYSKYYDTVEKDYKYGLKPFISYSCRYVKGSNYDFVVNYTLDNTITIIGKVKGEYVTKTGHLLYLKDNNDIPNEEILKENLITLDNDNNQEFKEYEYTIYNSQKIYKEPNEDKFFFYSSEYKKDYISNQNVLSNVKVSNGHLYSTSAKKYYTEAREFTNWVNEKLSDITQKDAVDASGNQINDFATNIGNEKIFKISNTNNPLATSSTFNEHRMNVIRKSLEDNVTKAIAAFSKHSTIQYQFAMPKLTEDEWYKIENNVCIITFLQGLPIGGKMFNQYCVVSNDTNKETVGNNSVYIIDTTTEEYHKPGCKTLIKRLANNNANILKAYPSSEFKVKKISLTGADSNAHTQITDSTDGLYAYFYPEEYTACYDCIVTASNVYSTDDIINDNVKDNEGNKINITNIRTIYLTALARSRYDLYLTNGYFGY